MNPIFADSVFYVALMVESDQYHQRAVLFTDSFRGRIVTTEYVLIEVANFLRRPKDSEHWTRLIEFIRNDPLTVLVPSSPTWFDRGSSLFDARPDKFWSLTACISFCVMTDLGLSHALTADKHFLQAGFTIEFP